MLHTDCFHFIIGERHFHGRVVDFTCSHEYFIEVGNTAVAHMNYMVYTVM